MILSQKRNVVKFIATLSLLFLNLSLFIIAKTPPAIAYEISIYNAYPSYFWIFLILSLVFGVFILIYHAFYISDSNLWMLGFAIMILTSITILLIPFFRGYFSYGREDVMTHIGIIKDIIITGHFGDTIFYPIIHINASTIVYITGLDLITIVNMYPIISYISYIMNIYLLATIISENRSQLLLIMAFAIMMIHGHPSFVPSLMSFFLIPLMLYFYFRNINKSTISWMNALIILVLFILLPFIHPMTTLLFAVVLVILFITLKSCMKLIQLKYIVVNISNMIFKNDVTSKLLILLAALFTWIATFAFFNKSVKRVFNSIFYDSTSTQIDKYGNLFVRAEIQIPEFIELVIRMYGHYLIYFVISITAYIMVIRWLVSTERKGNLFLVIFLNWYVFFSAIMVLTVFTDFIIGYGRVLKYVIFFSSIVNGLFFYELFFKNEYENFKVSNRIKRIGMASIIILLLMFSTMVMYNIFPSPLIKKYNHQVTFSEFEGMKWFFDYRNENIVIDDIKIVPLRFADALNGVETREKNVIHGWTYPPDHFNYTDKSQLYNYDADIQRRYLILSNLSELLYPKVYPKRQHLWRFNDSDFDALSYNKDINKLYTNSGIEMYLVKV